MLIKISSPLIVIDIVNKLINILNITKKSFNICNKINILSKVMNDLFKSNIKKLIP
jgi:hypothetical protein